MRKISVLAVALCIVLIGFAIRSSRGQQEATSQMPSRVVQGGKIGALLSVDKAPNVGGALAAHATYRGNQQITIDMNCSLSKGETSCHSSAWVPVNAPVGEWTISSITFQPYSSSGVELTKHGDLSFRVDPAQIELPSSATVSEIK